MKLCFISSYPPEKEGVGHFTKRLVDNLDRKLIQASVITFNYGVYKKNSPIKECLGLSPVNIIRFYKYLKALKPEVIHVQYATPIYRFFSPALWSIVRFYQRKHRTKIIITFHEVGREISILKKPGIIYYSIISTMADKVLVHTQEAKKTLIEKCHVSAEKIKVIPLGINTKNHINKLPNKIQEINQFQLHDKRVLLFFGYLHPDKGIDILIDASNLLFTKYPKLKQNTKILIAGDIRPRKGLFKLFGLIDLLYKYSLIRKVKQYNLSKQIKFLGYISNQDVLPLINRSIALIMPYKKVEQSGVLNIALELNIPIIASDVGGLGEYLKPTNQVFSPNNPKFLANRIESLLLGKQKLNLKSVYQKIRRHNSLEEVIKLHQSVYREVLA